MAQGTKRSLWFLLAVLCVSGLAAWLLLRDPRYDGRTVEEWFAAWQVSGTDKLEVWVPGQPAFDKRAVRKLLQIANSSDGREVRIRAIVILGQIGTEATDAVPTLTRLLGDSDSWVSYAATCALVRHGPTTAMSGIVELLSSGNKPSVLGALLTLTEFGPKANVAAGKVEPLSRSDDPDIAKNAAYCLRSIQGKASR
jgi:hypothetical protein